MVARMEIVDNPVVVTVADAMDASATSWPTVGSRARITLRATGGRACRRHGDPSGLVSRRQAAVR